MAAHQDFHDSGICVDIDELWKAGKNFHNRNTCNEPPMPRWLYFIGQKQHETELYESKETGKANKSTGIILQQVEGLGKTAASGTKCTNISKVLVT